VRAEGPTFWLLNGDLAWRTGLALDLAVDGDIRLAVDSQGPLAFGGVDGSLGGLRLPQGMAFDNSLLLYLLDRQGLRVRRFDPASEQFQDLPGIGGEGDGARQFKDPCAITIAGEDLYVADPGNRRVLVFALETLSLRYLWGPMNGAGHAVPSQDIGEWEPVDLASDQGRVVILDRHSGRVLLHHPGDDALHLLLPGSEANANRFSHIALDRQQRLYLLDGERQCLIIHDAEGRYLGEARDPGEVIREFRTPAIRLDHLGRFCLPESLARACGRDFPQAPPRVQDPLADCLSGESPHLFDRDGQAIDLPADPEPVGPRIYQRQGVWYSDALDSEQFNCQWHRIELLISSLPPGCKLVVSTYCDQTLRPIDEITNLALLPERLWETGQVILGRIASGSGVESTGLCSEDPLQQGTQYEEHLVQSHPGQYLWVRLELFGDGYLTPQVEALRVHYPRDSYLKYLPAVYSTDDESRWFLERFLCLFQTEWDAMEGRLEQIERYFDPDAVPAGPCLDYLAAQWLALPLEGDWDYRQKRRLLSAAPAIYERRGSAESLRRYLRVYLANITGIDHLLDTHDVPGPHQFPLLLEGFRQRNYLMLTSSERSVEEGLSEAVLGQGRPLWSPAVVGRLQLDVHAREGEVRLISTGDPERDLFHEHAHRFQLFVPSAWIRNRSDEEQLLRAVESEKPAHTQFQLCLVEPRFRLGVQSTVGVDTLLGEEPVAILACADRSDIPLNRPPRQRLGYDTVLGCGPGQRGGIPLHPGARIGTNTVLT
jgi:phage tail-like protein